MNTAGNRLVFAMARQGCDHAGRRGGHGLTYGTVKRGTLSGTIAVLFLAILLAPAFASSVEDSQEIPTEISVEIRATLDHGALPAGGEAYLAVVYDVPPDAHIQLNEFFYAQPAEGEPFVLGEPVRTASASYEGEAIFQGRTPVYYHLRLKKDIPPGRHMLKIAAGYQACIERPAFACFAPVDAVVEIPVEILSPGASGSKANPEVFAKMTQNPPPAPQGSAGEGTPASNEGSAVDEANGGAAGETGENSGAADPGAGSSSSTLQGEAGSPGPEDASAAGVIAPEGGIAGRLQEALAKRSFLAFLLVFLGGVATSFTPCVYPMIPITISYIGGRSRGKLGGLFLSVFFVLGIALTYSILGVVAASTGALFGSAMQSTPVLIAVSLVFFTMGASMLGAFDLALPSGMQTKLQSGPRAGVFGALFMGVVTGLVASPCVGPVVVVLLTFVAKIGSVGLGFLLLFVFALGLGMLFLVIGTFAGALNALPQAGGWMDTVKHVFGVILLGMGIFYVRSLLGPDLTWILSGALVLLVGTFMGAFRGVGEDPEKSLLFRKGFGILLVLLGGFVFLVGTARYTKVPLGSAMVAGGGSGATLVVHEGLAWVPDDVTGHAQARSQGKPAMMDFYADWCAACKELDEKTWSDPAVRREAERFVAIKLDLTERNETNKLKQAQYEVPGLPTVILFDSSGKEVHRFFGFRAPEDVLPLLRKIQ